MASNRKFNVPVNLVSLASDPASADEGDIYYNTTDDRIRVYKNSTWVNLAYADDVGITSTDYITFDTTPEATSTATGTIFWDSGDGLLKAIVDADVELGIGQESIAKVKNATGSTITKGSVVYVNGAQGQRPTVALADADFEATSSKTFGLAAEDILDGAEGFITTEGVLRGVNTNGLTEGGALWLSSTAGGYTQTMPSAPLNSVFLGYVIKASSTAGEIFVKVQNGYELNEIHNVLIDGTPADNEVLAWDNASSLWINQTAAEAGLIDTSSTAQSKTGNFTAPEVHATAKLVAETVGGDEGGEILLGKPATNSTIAGTGVTIDVWQNKLRFFEQGGDARGYYIDITGGGNGVSTNLVGGGSASNSFTTIATPSGTSPVADSSTDTLTLSAGTGLSVTGDSSADSVTFAVSDTDLVGIANATLTSAGFLKTDGSGNYSTITDNSSNWNTAYGWGNHASVGYITGSSPTITTPTISGLYLSDSSIIFEGSSADAFETTLTVTNPTADRTITLPNVSGTVVTTGDSGSVTNTMLAGSIANNKLSNSSITVNGTAISLGASGTVTANTTNALTIGTGLSGTSFNGSSAVTIAIDSTVATLTGSQTLTNKSLSDSTTYIVNVTDNTKKLDFNVSQVTTGTTVTMWVGGGTAPASGMVAGDIWIPNA